MNQIKKIYKWIMIYILDIYNIYRNYKFKVRVSNILNSIDNLNLYYGHPDMNRKLYIDLIKGINKLSKYDIKKFNRDGLSYEYIIRGIIQYIDNSIYRNEIIEKLCIYCIRYVDWDIYCKIRGRGY